MERFNSNQQINLDARNIHTQEMHDVSLSYTLEEASEDLYHGGSFSHTLRWEEPVFLRAVVDGVAVELDALRYLFGRDFLASARITILEELADQEAAVQEDRISSHLDY